VKTPQELAAETRQQELAEQNRLKQLTAKLKLDRRNMWVFGSNIKPPGDEELYFQYQPPVQPKNPHSANVAVIGLPNAGKSTLVNRIIGTKISAVSQKRSTTRRNILGVKTTGRTQLCFVDTPGILTDKNKRYLKEFEDTAWNSLDDTDIILYIMDMVSTISVSTSETFQKLRNLKSEFEEELKEMQEEGDNDDEFMGPKKFVLALNKKDLWDAIEEKSRVDPLDRLLRHFPDARSLFDRIFTISGLNGENVIHLQNYLLNEAPAREWTFHENTITNQSPVEILEELVRECIFQRLNQEVPYLVRQDTVGWTQRPDGALRIDMVLKVRKPAWKAMILGPGGAQIDGIRREVTQKLQTLFNRAVVFQLSVVVSKENPRATVLDEEDF